MKKSETALKTEPYLRVETTRQ